MRILKLAVLCLLLFAGCTANEHLATERVVAPTQILANVPRDEVLVGAGDIAQCSLDVSGMTASLLDRIEGTVFTTGDNVYQSGTAREFRKCYEPTWGRHKHRTRPSPGNHDYKTKDATPYFEYFGANAGPSGRGYYSYDLGSWHILSLNSNVPADASSAQMQWLREDLAKSRHKCMLAYWHHPVFTSGVRGPNLLMKEIFAELHKQGVDIVIAGHEHGYERFAPIDPRGASDPKSGIRAFTVGTGGALLGPFGKPHPMSEIRLSEHGVIKFTLKNSAYDWEFISVLPGTQGDSGSGMCH